MRSFGAILAVVGLFLGISTSFVTTAGNKSVSFGNETQLPPVEKRKIIGTWYNRDNGCTRSFEQVASKYYDVVRCKDGSGGKDGTQVSRANPSTFRPILSSSSGDHYVIQNNGDLAVRDKDGLIDTLPKHGNLWPGAQETKIHEPNVEGDLTKGLSCYDVGYRYGHTATSSMKGRPVNPSWDFAVPDRCKNDSAMQIGIKAGTRTAW